MQKAEIGQNTACTHPEAKAEKRAARDISVKNAMMTEDPACDSQHPAQCAALIALLRVGQ